jgi:polyhydroxyalkanoate synthesis regulator phasin
MAMDRFLGEAYILMRADGTLIPRDVKQAGKKAGEGYSKAFDKELKAAEKGSLQRFRRTLAQSTADIDFSRFRKEFGDIDNTVAGVRDRLDEMTASGKLTEKQAKRVRRELKQWAREQRGIATENKRVADSQKRLTQFFKDQSTALDNISRAREAQKREAIRLTREEEAAVQRASAAYSSYGRNILVASDEYKNQIIQQKQLSQFFRDQEAGLKRITKAQREQARLAAQLDFGNAYNRAARDDLRSFVDEVARATRDGNFQTLVRDGENYNDMLARMRHRLADVRDEIGLTDEQMDLINRRASETRTRWHDLGDSFDGANRGAHRFSEGFGRAFGRGSRNNFLNFVGSVVTGLAKLTIALPIKVLSLAAKAVGKFMEGFSAARSAGMGFFTAVSRGLAGILGGPGGLIKLMLGLVAGLVVFGKVLPAIISLMSLLAGAATALVGAFSIGITGALLALLPAIGAAVAGFGLLGFAIFQSVKDSKRMKASLDRIKADFKAFGREIEPEVHRFVHLLEDGFTELFSDFKPRIKSFMVEFREALTDPSTLQGLNRFSDSFARMFTFLGRAVSSFTSGLIGFFQPILPYAERLSRYIADMAARFDAWANSTLGRNQIAGFMDTAWLAARRVYNIITTIAEIIGKVFFQGTRSAGNSFLKDIEDRLTRMSEFLSTEAGKKKIDKWFTNAKKIGEDLGGIATSVKDIITNLNSPEGQANAQKIMQAFKDIAGYAETFSTFVDDVGRLVDMLQTPLSTTWANQLGLGSENKPPPKTELGSKPAPAMPSSGYPQVANPQASRQAAQAAVQTTTNLQKYLVTIDVNDALYQEKKRAIEAFIFTGKKITVEGNTALWDATKGTVAADIFKPKPVPVEGKTQHWDTQSGRIRGEKFPSKPVVVTGNPAQWDRTKGTVAGYQFRSKSVAITANASSVEAAVANVRRWLDSLPSSKTIRIAGVNAVGGLTMATGGTVFGPTRALIGEAGPEAVVPLRRNLNQVDPSVRALSAIAQGMKIPALASGGIAGASAGAPVIVEEGAVKVVTQATDGTVVARQVLNGLADALTGL